MMKKLIFFKFSDCFPKTPITQIRRTFSIAEKIKLKNRISLIDVDDVETSKDQWGELICVSLEKENIRKFFKHIEAITKSNIILNSKYINKIFSLIYNKNPKAVQKLYDYIDEKSIPIDSLSYYFLIMSAIQNKKTNLAFNFLLQASLFQTPMNLTVILSLFQQIEKTKETDPYRKVYMSIIDGHINKFYKRSEIYKYSLYLSFSLINSIQSKPIVGLKMDEVKKQFQQEIKEIFKNEQDAAKNRTSYPTATFLNEIKPETVIKEENEENKNQSGNKEDPDITKLNDSKKERKNKKKRRDNPTDNFPNFTIKDANVEKDYFKSKKNDNYDYDIDDMIKRGGVVIVTSIPMKNEVRNNINCFNRMMEVIRNNYNYHDIE